MTIDHEEVELFFALFLMDGREKHAARVDPHHLPWWKVVIAISVLPTSSSGS